ncbi:DUF4097 family beta strand repeat-containing protein [Spongiimicrobium salis]|uniref:hypothetical protein n=1 Tax=Spongiimicrobium salis TaxID=1667022 RepID=UPI00374CC588
MRNWITISLVCCFFIAAIGQEKKIKFNSGVLKICSSSHMKISGYDGDEVIIRTVQNNSFLVEGQHSKRYRPKITKNGKNANPEKSTKADAIRVYRSLTNGFTERKLEEGLKPLGTKSTNPADNLYLDIELKEGELLIKDYDSGKGQGQVLVLNKEYELLIPNSIKLFWDTKGCKKTKANSFFLRSKPWELKDFKGETEISSSFGSISLIDVSGPVLANTLGGNVKVVFDKVKPNELYSIISNDGHIDVQLPENANLSVRAIGSRILSDIDFKITEETIVSGMKAMQLQLNKSNISMKLNAGYGNVYLRKK